ncbi:MAG: hypothetical protein AAFU71_18020 [Cyanobacteria bacterium J06632_22]
MDALKPMQQLILWRLLISGEQPMQSVFDPKHRNALITAGFIRLEKRGRAKHVILEDKAWDWVAEQMQSGDFAVELPKRATTAIPAFELLLVKLGGYLRSHDIPLHEFLATQATEDGIDGQISQACETIASNSTDFRVRLTQLRAQLSEIPRDTLDNALIAMQQAEKILLRPVEDPQEISEADEAAALDMGSGDKRYFVVLKD